MPNNAEGQSSGPIRRPAKLSWWRRGGGGGRSANCTVFEALKGLLLRHFSMPSLLCGYSLEFFLFIKYHHF
jgi:hypothetical protein